MSQENSHTEGNCKNSNEINFIWQRCNYHVSNEHQLRNDCFFADVVAL